MWENQNSPRVWVAGGHNAAGVTLYICRFWVGSALVPGKLEDGKCWVPFAYQEHSSTDFEILKFRY